MMTCDIYPHVVHEILTFLNAKDEDKSADTPW